MQELERGLSKREEEITRRENEIMETAKQGEDRLAPSLIYITSNPLISINILMDNFSPSSSVDPLGF